MDLAKIKISLLLIVPVISGAATGGAIYASVKGDVSALKDQHAETRARVEKLEPQVQQNTTDSAVLKEAVQDIRATVHRIEDTHR